MDDLNRYKKQTRSLKNDKGSDNNNNKGTNNNNALYIGGAIVAGAILLYSGLKVLFQNKNEETKTSNEKELTISSITKNTNEKPPIKPNEVEPPVKVVKTPEKEVPKKIVPSKDSSTKNEKEVLSSTTTKNFSGNKQVISDEEKLKEFAKLIEKEKEKENEKIKLKQLTKRVWKVLSEKDSEKFKVPTQFDINEFSSLSEQFDNLDINIKRFIFHLYQASWISAFVNATQSSTAKELFEMFMFIFGQLSIDELRQLVCEKAKQKVTKEEFEEFLNYAALVLLNLGNYHHEDQRKFIPNLPKSSFEKIINAFEEKFPNTYYRACGSIIYDVTENNQRAGVEGSDALPFYSGEVAFEETLLSKQDVLNAERFTSEGLLNSCLVKTNIIDDGRDVYELLTAASTQRDVIQIRPKDVNIVLKRNTGLFSGYMKIINQHLFSSLSFLPGISHQKDVILKYIDYFSEGSNSYFEVAQRIWQFVHNPQIEFSFGFVPTFKDPFKKRGEFRSFVGFTNRKELSQKILSNARKIVDQIPMSNQFAQTPFSLPILEFVDLLCYVHSFVPSSTSSSNVEFMNRPKTIIFTNTFKAKESDLQNFSENDQKLIKENYSQAKMMYNTIYQVFGQPFGKIFTKNKMGNYNFDISMINPLSNQPFAGHYLPGESFSSVFGSLAPLLDSLKSLSISLFLSSDPNTLSVFGFDSPSPLSSVVWLLAAKSFLKSISFYNFETSQWESDKHHANFIFGSYLFENKMFEFETPTEDSLLIKINSEKISTEGNKCLEELMKMIFVYRAIGNVEQTKVLFQKYSVFDEKLKTLQKKFFPRRSFSSLFVQPNLIMTPSTSDNSPPSFVIKSYPPTKEGVIQSFADRFK